MKEEKKEKTNDFIKKAKQLFDRGISASKKAFGVAGEAVQDFSHKSEISIEKKQLESKLKKQYAILGEVASKILVKKGATVSVADAKVAPVMKEISRLNKEIKLREKALAEANAKSAEKKETARKEKAAKKNTSKKESTTGVKKAAPKKVAAKKTSK